MKKIERDCYELMGELLEELCKEIEALADGTPKEDKKCECECDCTAELEKLSAQAVSDLMTAIHNYVKANPGRTIAFGGDTYISLNDLDAIAAGH